MKTDNYIIMYDNRDEIEEYLIKSFKHIKYLQMISLIILENDEVSKNVA